MMGRGKAIRIRSALIAAIAPLAAACGAARAEQPAAPRIAVSFAESAGDHGWRHFSFPGRAATVFTPEGAATLRIRAQRSASLIYRAV